MKIGWPGLFQQETGQGFLVTAGALWLFWKEGAPTEVLYMVCALGLAYIIGEKVRSVFQPGK